MVTRDALLAGLGALVCPALLLPLLGCQDAGPLSHDEMQRLMADPGHVDNILIDGANRARAIAAETMNATKDIVGFIRPR